MPHTHWKLLNFPGLGISAGVKEMLLGLPYGPAVKNPQANTGDMGLIPGPRKSHTLQSSKAHVLQLMSPHARAHTL